MAKGDLFDLVSGGLLSDPRMDQVHDYSVTDDTWEDVQEDLESELTVTDPTGRAERLHKRKEIAAEKRRRARLERKAARIADYEETAKAEEAADAWLSYYAG